MEQYPSIDGSAKAPIGKPCIAFYKYDGSNLRWEWNPKKGWFKFGTRTQLFDKSDPLWGKAIPIFMNSMADEIVYRVKHLERGCQRITAFTEFFGPSTFAGVHPEMITPGTVKNGVAAGSEEKELRLFDVYLFKRGLIKPRQFVRSFGDMPHVAQVIHDGNLNRQFIEDVRMGLYPVNEGVIAKGDDFMVKVKTYAYLKKLNDVFGTQYRNYWE